MVLPIVAWSSLALVGRRQFSVGGLGAFTVASSSPWAPTSAPLAAAADDEVAAVLRDVIWDAEPSFTKEDFRRLDESADAGFYGTPRFVYHVDDAAVAATQLFYERLFTQLAAQKQGAALDVLDLCSSWVSHYPKDNTDTRLRLARVAGLGMNAEELAANTRLSDFVVRDLNKQPVLPYGDASFDAVTCTVSIDYLTKPLEVCREVARVLRPGGQVAFVFSDRLFFSKAVALWTGKE